MKKTTLLLASLVFSLAGFSAPAARAAGETTLKAPALAASLENSRWAFTLPNGRAGWLGFSTENEKLSALLLWGSGHPRSVAVALKNDSVELRRAYKHTGKNGARLARTDLLTARQTASGTLAIDLQTLDENGKPVGRPAAFTATRIPDLPPAPDLSKLKYGAPVKLIRDDLSNWESMNPKAYNGWTLKNGVLTNTVVFPDGTKKRGANLRTTDKSFKDFRLAFEVSLPPDSNSGVYLRGIYEIQMSNSRQENAHQTMGSLYGRLAPSTNAEKPANEWQTVDIILADRHVTVVLNGVTIIDNQPVLGVTGGAITADEFVPGPIYLQGDHTNASYRNMTLTPIIKELR
ncbi:hypothetical protein M2103_000344 [Ereboglobus sp. PH5-5]|uniref:3-keto-disaccharide hydrolase n=1 Tax=Ereboglobus sp. PH5-5 TaxID=2940529 RepID=UPI002405D903|nr:DUF1080 domain-containing protein [Ereboglobus sp. PH5-5]MDF9832136.1 hypothetical protein [Ereboglobus sp. PH5-5]